MNLSNLPSDVLYTIIDYLDFDSMLMLSETCKQFYNIPQLTVKSRICVHDDPKMKHLRIMEKITRKYRHIRINMIHREWSFIDFVKEMGPNVKSIAISGSSVDFRCPNLFRMLKYTPNIEELEIGLSTSGFFRANSSVPRLKSLKRLCLPKFRHNLDDKFLAKIQKSGWLDGLVSLRSFQYKNSNEMLETLNRNDISELELPINNEEMYLKLKDEKFEKLKTFKCNKPKENLFNEFIPQLKSVEKLQTNSMKNDTLIIVCNHLENLRYLEFEIEVSLKYEILHCLSNLKNLEILKIKTDQINYNPMQSTTVFKLPKLKELQLQLPHMGSEKIVGFSRSCPNLEKFIIFGMNMKGVVESLEFIRLNLKRLKVIRVETLKLAEGDRYTRIFKKVHTYGSIQHRCYMHVGEDEVTDIEMNKQYLHGIEIRNFDKIKNKKKIVRDLQIIYDCIKDVPLRGRLQWDSDDDYVNSDMGENNPYNYPPLRSIY